jgi:hypothetical protein
MWRRLVTMKYISLLLLSSTMFAQQAQYRHDGKAPLNDLNATPGVADPSLTKAQLCDPSFRTGTERDVTEEMKKKVCEEYGITTGCPGKGYEIDHLVSIEIGGSEDIANLWPQPADAPGVIGFHTKDVVEDRSHKAVCSGKLTLQQAQDGIRTDWLQYAIANGFLNTDGSEVE